MLLKTMLDGMLPGCPDLYFPIVDVRDVAAAHILAMTTPAAAGERFLLSNGPALAMQEIGTTMKAALGAAARHVPTRAIPSFVVRIGALFNAEFRSVVPDLGYAKKTSNEKARRLLGWTPCDPHEAIVAAAESMVRKGLVKA